METLVEIAREYQLPLEEYSVEELRPHVQVMPDEPRSMQHFLSKFYILRRFFQSESVIRRIAAEAVADAAADNVKYLELRFTPPALSQVLHCSFDEIVTWVSEAVGQAAREYHIQVGLIVSMNRHESVATGERVMQAALAHVGNGVVGLDIAGQESGFSVKPFSKLFERARESGLGVTVHAGEWRGPDSVRDAINLLGAERIGHGVRAAEDPALIDLLVECAIPLEVCPVSNIKSGVFPRLEAHALPGLLARQVRATLNTDDTLVADTSMSHEVLCSIKHLALSMEDVKRCMLNAARAAFLPEAARAALVQQFETWYGMAVSS